MTNRVYRECSRCVMDSHDIHISFDENGFCNHCNDFLNNTASRTYQGEASDKLLQSQIEKIRESGKGKEYDCVIGVSGGVDSIYLTYLARQWGLRPLAVHMDNGWNARVAVQNIKKALDLLKVDLYTEVLDWPEFRDLQLAFLKASVPEAENPTDMAIQGVLHKTARKFKVRYILSGGNFATEGILPKHFQYNPKDLKYLKAIHRRFGSVRLKNFPAFGFRHEFIYKILHGIRILYPLNFVPYNKEEAVQFLTQDLGWENYGGKHHESQYTKFIQSYWLTEKFGIDYRRATFSTMICTGELTREKASGLLKTKAYNEQELENDLLFVSKKFEISVDELKSLISRPPKLYIDYPNADRSLEFGYSVYRKIKGQK